MMATVGIAVFCLAGMKHLDRCLKSAEWADDIDVVWLEDGNGLLHNPASLQHGQRTDWVLHLWGEESIEKELAEQLSSLRGIPVNDAAAAYRIPVRSSLLGNWIDGSLWGPNPSLRLTRERRCWPAAWWNLDYAESGRTGTLSGCIKDYSAAELSSGIGQMNALTSLWARVLSSRGQAPGLASAGLFSFLVFARQVANRRVPRDGFAGLTLSVLGAYATLLVGAKAWERRKSSADPCPATVMGRTPGRRENDP